MICDNCKIAADQSQPELHKECKGDTHCDCQHKITEVTQDGSVKPTSE